MRRIALLAEYTPTFPPHMATTAALEHSSAALGVEVAATWVSTMELRFTPGSRIAAIYGAEGAEEEYYCNFGVNPDKIPFLRQGVLQISGSDAEGEIRVVELCDHPFFLGTLFVPQLRSNPTEPHPLVTAFVQAVVHQ